jgi:CDP-diacylglycerol--glycerol-3-phosphate 3-phosphatidyltransferase
VTRFFNASNVLSIFRALLTIPFVLVMLGEEPSSRFWGCLLMAVAAATDKLDGVLARKFGQITEWGKILDPLADKIGVAVVAAVLVYLQDIPAWFLAAVVGRDVLILAGGVYVKAKRGTVLASNRTGKWAVSVIALALFLALVGVSPIILEILIWLAVAMLAISSYFYYKRFREVMGPPLESRR